MKGLFYSTEKFHTHVPMRVENLELRLVHWDEGDACAEGSGNAWTATILPFCRSVLFWTAQPPVAIADMTNARGALKPICTDNDVIGPTWSTPVIRDRRTRAVATW